MERGLTATKEEVENYVFDKGDFLVVNALLNGASSIAEVASQTGLTYSATRHRLLDPVRVAWISRKLEEIIPQRLGMLLGACYRRAMSGDVRAINVILDRFAPLFKPGAGGNLYQTQINIGGDVSKLSDEELGVRIQEQISALGPGAVATVTPREGEEAGTESPEILDADFEAAPVSGE